MVDKACPICKTVHSIFEPHASKKSKQGGAEVAHLAHNQKVGGSNPPPATKLTRGQDGNVAVCKTEEAGSTPARVSKGARSQAAKAPDFDSGIAGSSPAAPAKLTPAQRAKQWRTDHPEEYREQKRTQMRGRRARLKEEKWK